MTKPPLSNFLSTAIRLLRKMGRGGRGAKNQQFFKNYFSDISKAYSLENVNGK